MSAYADFDRNLGSTAKAKKMKSSVAALAGDARSRLADARERGLDLAHISSQKAGQLARTAGGHARRKPVSTSLIVAAAGVGLLFLFSGRARAAAMSAGPTLWNAISKRR
jgi:hypothetical protein